MGWVLQLFLSFLLSFAVYCSHQLSWKLKLQLQQRETVKPQISNSFFPAETRNRNDLFCLGCSHAVSADRLYWKSGSRRFPLFFHHDCDQTMMFMEPSALWIIEGGLCSDPANTTEVPRQKQRKEQDFSMWLWRQVSKDELTRYSNTRFFCVQNFRPKKICHDNRGFCGKKKILCFWCKNEENRFFMWKFAFQFYSYVRMDKRLTCCECQKKCHHAKKVLQTHVKCPQWWRQSTSASSSSSSSFRSVSWRHPRPELGVCSMGHVAAQELLDISKTFLDSHCFFRWNFTHSSHITLLLHFKNPHSR